MNVDKILLCWDGLPVFDGMWEIHQRLWPKFGVEPVLVTVGQRNGLPEEAHNVIHLMCDGLEQDHHHWQTPASLLFAAQSFGADVVMTTGIDQFPMSGRFKDLFTAYPDDGVCIGFGDAYDTSHLGTPFYCSSHVAATGDSWKSLMQGMPDSFEGFLKHIDTTKPDNLWASIPNIIDGWGLDEAVFRALVMEAGVPVYVNPRSVYADWKRRSCGRAEGPCDPTRLSRGEYTEMHSERPMLEEERAAIEFLIESL